MDNRQVAGVAELPQASNINECDTATANLGPAETAGNPGECRTFERHRERFARIAEAVTVSANGHPQIDAPTPGDMQRAIARAIRETGALDAERSDIDRRLGAALIGAGNSALGFPGTVDTFKAMLDKAGLALVLR